MSFTRAALVPELLVTDLATSLRFWCGLCGFAVAYDRPEDGFAYLHRDANQVMLETNLGPARRWIPAPLDRPFGRGMNLQMAVADIAPVLDALASAAWPLYLAAETKWYRAGTQETGVRQFIVQDPDGYLLRFSQPLGDRPA